jgi:hypothetical protein
MSACAYCDIQRKSGLVGYCAWCGLPLSPALEALERARSAQERHARDHDVQLRLVRGGAGGGAGDG